MARTYRVRPSQLVALENPYEAYCLDEALCEYIARIENGQALRPTRAGDNRELIETMKGGASHAGRRTGRGQP